MSNSFSRTLSSSSTSEMVAPVSSRPVSGGWAHIAALLSVLPSLKPHAGLPGASFLGGTVARARGDGLDSTLKLSCLNRTPHSYICQGQRSETGLKSHLFLIFWPSLHQLVWLYQAQIIQNHFLISKSLLQSLKFRLFVPSLECSGGLDIEKGSISGV